MYNEIITLVSETRSTDKYGDITVEKTEKTVFADLRSIGQSEFYQAEAVGLKPELKFVLPDYLEYNNEKIIKYQPYNESEEAEFTVLRTYRAGNELEIVVKRGVDE